MSVAWRVTEFDTLGRGREEVVQGNDVVQTGLDEGSTVPLQGLLVPSGRGTGEGFSGALLGCIADALEDEGSEDAGGHRLGDTRGLQGTARLCEEDGGEVAREHGSGMVEAPVARNLERTHAEQQGETTGLSERSIGSGDGPRDPLEVRERVRTRERHEGVQAPVVGVGGHRIETGGARAVEDDRSFGESGGGLSDGTVWDGQQHDGRSGGTFAAHEVDGGASSLEQHRQGTAQATAAYDSDVHRTSRCPW